MEKMKISQALWLSGAITAELRCDIEALETDAQRFNGLRMILCEPDKALRERCGEAFVESIERLTESFTSETNVTPEMVNAIVDTALLAACEARK